MVCTLGRRRAAYAHNGSHTRTTVFGFATTDKGGFVKRHAAFTKEFVDFLEAVRKWFGKTMMVLDGASQHRAGIALEALKEMNGEARPVSLPPGYPDLSAIEGVWRQMKRAVLDAPAVKLHKMCGDMDRWRVESLPGLEIENCPYRKVQCRGRAGILPLGIVRTPSQSVRYDHARLPVRDSAPHGWINSCIPKRDAAQNSISVDFWPLA